MKVVGLPLTPIPETQEELTPELELVLCLRWAKERLNNSKADGSSRLASVFSDIGQDRAMCLASVPDLNTKNIESAARQLVLNARFVGLDGIAANFGFLAYTASNHVQNPCIVIVWTDTGHAFPMAAYQSGGKLKGWGSHLYVFLPLCGELKLSPKTAVNELASGILLSAPEGRPQKHEDFVIATGGGSATAASGGDTTLRHVANDIYAPMHEYDTVHHYAVVEGPLPIPAPKPKNWPATAPKPPRPKPRAVGPPVAPKPKR